MSARSLAKASLSSALEGGVRGLLKNSADDISELLLKNSDDLIDTAIRQSNQAVLIRAVADAFPNITPDILETLAKNSDDISTIARQGVDELPTLGTKVTTAESKSLLEGAETLAKSGNLGSATADEGVKLGEEATKQQGGLLNFIKNNPKTMLVGLTVTALGLYIGINSALGKSPSESLNEIANLAGSALTEVAGLLGGLAASFAKPFLSGLFNFLKIAGVVLVGLIAIILIVRYIMNMKKRKEGEISR